MTAYYNENEPAAAAWLRELVKTGLIAPGEVDERSIVDIRPSDLAGFVQCHFFAGVGGWPYALRRAGWADDRPVWTGSCPCQPFSAAGKGGGFDDERHLWPAFFHLIGECGPAIVFGEQVASKSADPWIDLVQTDMEALGYAFGAVPFPSAGIGAPHIRDRTYWLADADNERSQGRGGMPERPQEFVAGAGGVASWMDDTASSRHERTLGISEGSPRDEARLRLSDAGRETGRMGDASVAACERDTGSLSGAEATVDGIRVRIDGRLPVGPEYAGASLASGTGPTNGLWRDADWLFCRDGKWRPVEPGSFPLAHGAPARVGRLRGYGNAVNAEAAKVFIECFLEGRGDLA